MSQPPPPREPPPPPSEAELEAVYAKTSGDYWHGARGAGAPPPALAAATDAALRDGTWHGLGGAAGGAALPAGVAAAMESLARTLTAGARAAQRGFVVPGSQRQGEAAAKEAADRP